MPMKYRKIFAHEDIIVPYRLRKDGVYEARRAQKRPAHRSIRAGLRCAERKIHPRTAQRGRTRAHCGQKPCGGKLRRIHLTMAGSETSARQAFDIQRVRQALRKNLIPAFGQYTLSQIDPRQTAIVSSRLCQRGQAPHGGKTRRPSTLYLRRGGGRLQDPLPDGEGRIAPLSNQEGQRAHLRGRGEAGALLPRECG